jgi:hypothetical protein
MNLGSPFLVALAHPWCPAKIGGAKDECPQVWTDWSGLGIGAELDQSRVESHAEHHRADVCPGPPLPADPHILGVARRV